MVCRRVRLNMTSNEQPVSNLICNLSALKIPEMGCGDSTSSVSPNEDNMLFHIAMALYIICILTVVIARA